ncbi:MAG: S8 family serine peptidase [Bacteroidota bacterium]
MRIPHLLFLMLTSLGLHGVWAQDALPTFKEGSLFIKVEDDAGIILPEFEGAPDEVALRNIEGLSGLVNDYDIYYLKHPFKTQSPLLENIYEVKFREVAARADLKSEFQAISYIDYAEEVPVYHKFFEPDDYRPLEQSYLPVINAEGAWDISQGSEDVVIAIVDDAVQLSHEDLSPNIWVNPGEIAGNGIDDDGNGFVDDVNGYNVAFGNNNPEPRNLNFNHGTSVAGCASAATNNGTGIASIGFNCSIMGVGASVDEGLTITNSLEGIDYAIAAKADIVNMSFGGRGFSITVSRLIEVGHQQGIIFVASSGNSGEDEANYPAAYPFVISVGATTVTDRVANFSTVHSSVDVMAPGVQIRTTAVSAGSGRYGPESGTSFSAPVVAGLLGLMKSINPCLTPDQAEQFLKETAINIDAINPTDAGKLGAGRVDAAAAVAAVQPTALPVANFSTVLPDGCSNDVIFNFEIDEEDVSGCPSSVFWVVTNDQGYTGTSTELNPVFTLPDTATYIIQLIVNNQLGTSQIADQLSFQPNVAYSLNAGANESLCLGESAQLEALITAPEDLIDDISWTPGFGLSNSRIANPVANPTITTTYTVVTSLSNGCELTDEVTVNVSPNPTTFINPNVAETTIDLGDSVRLQVFGAEQYSWSPGIWLSDSTGEVLFAKPEQTVTYVVTGFNSSGCSLEDEITIIVNGTNPLSINPWDETLGEILAPYPNPASERITFRADLLQSGKLTLRMMDIQGREVATLFNDQVGRSTFSLDWDRGSEPAGMYLMLWEFDGAVATQKFLLE